MTTSPPSLDKWQTTFFFNIRANFKTGSDDDPDVTVSVPLGKRFPSEDVVKAATATATEDLTKALRSAIDEAIAGNNASEHPFLGANDWKTVWGPQVFCIGPHVFTVPKSFDKDFTAKFNATNAMYVVHSAGLGRYIVAIAATNNPSLYDWFAEDADTSHVVAWDGALHVWKEGIAAGTVTTAAIAAAAAAAATAVTATADVPCISQATFAGSTILLNLVDTVITRKTLVDFLKGLTPPADTTVTFTGHSLAGALSPALAMACFDPVGGLLKDSAWRISDARVYPTAGATPGNGPFAGRFNGAGWGGADDTGKRPWQVWNTNLYNNLDVVPHAWGKAMLGLIPGLYAVHYPLEAIFIKGWIDLGLSHREKGEEIAGPYTPINNRALNPTGMIHAGPEFYDHYTVEGVAGPVPLTRREFLESSPTPTDKRTIPWYVQAGLQHTIAYSSLLEIPEQLLSSNATV